MTVIIMCIEKGIFLVEREQLNFYLNLNLYSNCYIERRHDYIFYFYIDYSIYIYD